MYIYMYSYSMVLYRQLKVRVDAGTFGCNIWVPHLYINTSILVFIYGTYMYSYRYTCLTYIHTYMHTYIYIYIYVYMEIHSILIRINEYWQPVEKYCEFLTETHLPGKRHIVFQKKRRPSVQPWVGLGTPMLTKC